MVISNVVSLLIAFVCLMSFLIVVTVWYLVPCSNLSPRVQSGLTSAVFYLSSFLFIMVVIGCGIPLLRVLVPVFPKLVD